MILGFVGPSGCGKTYAIEKIVRRIGRKYRVAVIKHAPKGIHLDVFGKDSERVRRAGARLVGVTNSSCAIFSARRSLNELIKNFLEGSEVILVEGFSSSSIPKVAVGEGRWKNVVMHFDEHIDVDKVIKFIEEGVEYERVLRKLPGVNCGRCGFSCEGMAREILDGKKSFEDCMLYSEKPVEVIVNGRKIPLGAFAREIVENTIVGLVSSLKTVGEIREVEIRIRR